MNAIHFDASVALAETDLRCTLYSRGHKHAIRRLHHNCNPSRSDCEGYQVLKNDFDHLVDGGVRPEIAIMVICE